MHREHQDFGLRDKFSEVADTVKSIHLGHGNVENDEVGMSFLGRLEGFYSVFGFADHGKLVDLREIVTNFVQKKAGGDPGS